MAGSSSPPFQVTRLETVSVVIPLFNKQSTVGRAIECVLAQSYDDFRIYVVDDGSTDRSMAVVRSYDDPRIELVEHEVNKGAAAARNTGIAMSKGRYVAFLDADDVWHPQKLARQVAFMENQPDRLGACFCDFALHGLREEVRAPRPAPEWIDNLIDGCFVSPGTTMIVRRAVYEHVGGYDTGFGRLEDWDWLLRCVGRYELSAFPEVLADIHVLGVPSAETVLQSTRRMRDLHEDFVRSQRGTAGCRRFLASLAIENFVACLRTGRHAKATGYLLTAVVRSPGRVYSLFARRLFGW